MHTKLHYTRLLAEFAKGTKFEDIPPELVKLIKLHILDALGIALGAYATQHPLIQAVVQFLTTTFRHGKGTTVWGAGTIVPAPEAAFANAVLANFLDFSDGHYMGGHINDRLVPVAWAAAEMAGASGKDLLTALAVGYEVYIDLAYTLFTQTDPAEARLPYFVVLGPVAASIVAGKLLDLSVEQLAGAMGLAASYQLGSAQYVLSGGHEKDLSPGHEARRGLISALLASHNVLGSTDILEGDRGLCSFLRAPHDFHPRLGEVWRIGECYFKPYPACRYLHASIEAALNIVKDCDIDTQEIEAVVISTNSSSASRMTYEIKSHVNAIFSHAYQVASVLRYKRVDLPTTWEEKIKDPLFVTIMHKVKVNVTEEFERLHQQKTLVQPPWPAEVKVVLKGGKHLCSRVMVPKGDPVNPMSEGELRAKFEGLVPNPAVRGQLIDALESLENLEHLATLTQLITI